MKVGPEQGTDTVLFRTILDELYTPVVGDVMDGLGLLHQFLPAECRSQHPRFAQVLGRAMPIIYTDLREPPERPFGKLTEALDQIEPEELVVVTGGSRNYAVWGEILTAAAKTRGARGAIIDGWHRDTLKVLEQDWPVFSRGAFAQDAGVRGQVVDYRCLVMIGETRVSPGDLIFGDVDGVLVIPQAQEGIIIKHALEKARGEKTVRLEIENGMSSTDAFNHYGIL